MNISRRRFLKNTGLLALASSSGCVAPSSTRAAPVLVNDVHTQLNPTLVRDIRKVSSLKELRQAVRRARREHRPISIAGGRHAAGGQQFATAAELIDTGDLRRVLLFDQQAGLIVVETGIQWPELMGFLSRAQEGQTKAWTIAQKQTGTDRLSIGGALSANAHGRGFRLPPFVSNLQSFVLVDEKGECHTCSRKENSHLFSLVIGGLGLFGFVYSAILRLVPPRKVRRVVKKLQGADLPAGLPEAHLDSVLCCGVLFGLLLTSQCFPLPL